MKAVPFDVFVALSMTIFAHLTLPYFEKIVFRAYWSVFVGKFLMKIVLDKS